MAPRYYPSPSHFNPPAPVFRPNKLYSEPLDATKREIRLLTVSPGRFEEPLQCSLSKDSLDRKCRYDALSYVWGDPKGTRYIVVQGFLFPVTFNLEDALRHLRHTTSAPLTIWVDAICINQNEATNDNQERYGQVGIMDQIYSSASKVVIWLGCGNDKVIAAFESLQKVRAGRVEDENMEILKPFFLTIVDTLPWFRRVWTIQEMVLSRDDPEVVYGHLRIPWTWLFGPWEYIEESMYDADCRVSMESSFRQIQAMSNVMPRLGRFCRLRKLLSISKEGQGKTTDCKQAGLSLRQLVVSSCRSKATRAEDMIFGVLGLLTSTQRHSLLPRICKQPVHVVFAEATAEILKEMHGMYFFSRMHHTGLGVNLSAPGLPSWALDFTAQDVNNVIAERVFDLALPRSMFGASLGMNHPDVVDNGRTLKVVALTVDSIESIVPINGTWPACLASLAEIEDQTYQAHKRSFNCRYLPRCVQTLRSSEPLWRVLIPTADLMGATFFVGLPWEAMYRHVRELWRHGLSRALLESIPPERISKYAWWLSQYLPGKVFFTTKSGFIGMANPGVRTGDELSFWYGSTHPFVTRPNPFSPGTCGLVGTAYVGGMMRHGNLLDKLYDEGLLRWSELLVR